jgi:ribosomal protein S18 acetylase RimI-like enzyme
MSLLPFHFPVMSMETRRKSTAATTASSAETSRTQTLYCWRFRRYTILIVISLILWFDCCSGFIASYRSSSRSFISIRRRNYSECALVTSATKIDVASQAATSAPIAATDNVPVQRTDHRILKKNDQYDNQSNSGDHDIHAVHNCSSSLFEDDHEGRYAESNFDDVDENGDDADTKNRSEQLSAVRTAAAALFNTKTATINRPNDGSRATNKIMDALRKTARGISSITSSNPSAETTHSVISPQSRDSNSQQSSSQPHASLSQQQPSSTKTLSPISQSIIHAAIDEILRLRKDRKNESDSTEHLSYPNVTHLTAAFSAFHQRRMGVLGDSLSIYPQSGVPRKNANVLETTTSSYSTSTDKTTQPITTTTAAQVRIATPADDMDIAYLRMSVFSDIAPDLRSLFCARSCQAIAARRIRGAICFVATQQQQQQQPTISSTESTQQQHLLQQQSEQQEGEVIVGSAECSYHEFFGTRLGRCRKQNALLYITEVAVNPSVRRLGIGTAILRAIDIWAEQQLNENDDGSIESMYLHVDVSNRNAIQMYERAGYYKVLSNDPMYTEFTSLLNLQPGATHGREHYLLCKNLISQPIWLMDNYDDRPSYEIVCIDQHDNRTRRHTASTFFDSPMQGRLGIEIPAQ